MRPELHSILSLDDEISQTEIGFTVELCSDLVQSHWSATHRQFEDLNEEELRGAERCSLGRQNFKTAYEIQFIWQMGLWRIIALMDGILSQRFPHLSSKRLQEKLQIMQRQGLVSSDLAASFKQWIRLRNTLSHRPARAPDFSHQLEREDLEELASLAEAILAGSHAPTVSHRDA